MTKTTNYQLNQWEKTDRILMDDFNADNQKIEAALLGKVPMTLLYDETLTDKNVRIDLDAAGQHWEKYAFVLLTYTPTPNSPGYTMRISIENKEDYASHRDLLAQNAQTKPCLLETTSYNGVTMLFFSHGNPHHLKALCFDSNSFYYSSSNYGYTQPISVTGGFKGGERLRVYGIL